VGAEHLDRGGSGPSLADRGHERGEHLPIAVEQHLLLGVEVVEDRLTGDAGSARDLLDGHRLEAVLGEQLGRGLGDRRPGPLLLTGPEADLREGVNGDFATGHV
jgi:hypothetical protein